MENSNFTVVVNCRKEPFDVYIGRPSEYGNPFSTKENSLAKFHVRTRRESIERFREWAPKQPGFLERVKMLRGKRLGCWCHPKPCHGDVWVEFCNMSDYVLQRLVD